MQKHASPHPIFGLLPHGRLLHSLAAHCPGAGQITSNIAGSPFCAGTLESRRFSAGKRSPSHLADEAGEAVLYVVPGDAPERRISSISCRSGKSAPSAIPAKKKAAGFRAGAAHAIEAARGDADLALLVFLDELEAHVEAAAELGLGQPRHGAREPKLRPDMAIDRVGTVLLGGAAARTALR